MTYVTNSRPGEKPRDFGWRTLMLLHRTTDNQWGKTFKLSCLVQKAKMFHFQFKGHFSLWPKLALLKESWWKHFIMYLCLLHTSVSIPAFLFAILIPPGAKSRGLWPWCYKFQVGQRTTVTDGAPENLLSNLFPRSTDLLLFSLTDILSEDFKCARCWLGCCYSLQDTFEVFKS